MEDLFALSDDLRTPFKFLTSLAIGLLLGLQRERTPSAKAGLRTFALVSLFGTATGLLAEIASAVWLSTVGLALVGLMMISAYIGDEKPEADSGTTTVIAALLCFCLGLLVWYDRSQLAVTIGIVATALLHFKTELHGLTARFSRQDVASILQFAVLSFVVLPLLPNEGFGPYRVLNPYHIWMMVVLVSGLGLAGYLALRLVGGRRSVFLIGIFGGLVSSTATTLVYARQGKEVAALVPVASAIVLIGNLVVLARLAVMAVAVAPTALKVLLPVLASGIAVGVLALLFRASDIKPTPAFQIPELANPTTVRVALGFGALYGLILLASAWVSERAGNQGLYAIAAVSGLADVDAITLSGFSLFNSGQVNASVAATTVAIAFIAASAFKLVVLRVVGNRTLLERCAFGLTAPVIGIVVGLALFA